MYCMQLTGNHARARTHARTHTHTHTHTHMQKAEVLNAVKEMRKGA